jgi:hypothetical protein
MERQFRIRVYGKQRQDIDPALLAQIVILFGRQLHHQRHQHHNQQGHGAAGQAKIDQGSPASGSHGESGVTRSDPSCGQDTPRTPEGDEGNAGDIAGDGGLS